MPTTTFPPILIWQPGGGTPIGPVSNPPVYSQADVTQLVIGQAYVDVVFGSIQTDNNWVLVECDVVNTTDLSPLNIWPGLITNRTTAGFRVYLNGLPDSGNYYLHWAVSGVNIQPVAATLYLFTGPTSSAFGVNKTFTVKLPPSTTLSAPVTVTPNDGGAGGTFSPSSVTVSSGSASATFVYNAVAYGAVTISVTNSGTLIDPASIVYTSIAPIYTFTGPTGGVSGMASTNFTVQVAGDATLAVPTTVTPHDGGGGGTFTPTTVLLVAGVPVHFTYTPASAGNKTISVTNNGGLPDPASLTYTVVAIYLLDSLTSYWKLDEASGTRVDTQGTNHLAATNAPAGSAGKINNGALFVAASSQYLSIPDNLSLRVTSDFTFSAWVKCTSQVNSIILGKASGSVDYLLSYDTGSGFYFIVNAIVGANSAAMGAPVANGAWTHIVVWYDSGTSKTNIRINDANTYVCSGTPALVSTAGIFAIGSSGSSLYADALVDEVGFWKRKLTSAEITALYNGGSGAAYSTFLSSTSVPTVVVRDTFTGTNGTALPSHTMDVGTGWTRYEGTGANQFTIQNNKCQGYLDAGSAYAYQTDSGVANCVIQCVAVFGVADGGHYCQIVFRYSDASNWWSLRVNGSGSANVELVKSVAGAETVVSTASYALAIGSNILLKVTLAGTSISVLADATALSTTDSFNQTATKHGMRMYWNGLAASTMDDFKVTT